MIVNLLGVLLIVWIVWWFWIYKPKAISANDQQIKIIVENGVYSPAHIEIKSNTPSALIFLRKDASACAEQLLIPDLDIFQELPLNKPISIQIPAMDTGEYEFYCQMKMYRGSLVVGSR